MHQCHVSSCTDIYSVLYTKVNYDLVELENRKVDIVAGHVLWDHYKETTVSLGLACNKTNAPQYQTASNEC